MFGAQMHVAESAEEAAAGVARNGGALLRMVEAARFAIEHDGFAGLAAFRGRNRAGKISTRDSAPQEGQTAKSAVCSSSTARETALRADGQRRGGGHL